MKRKALMNAIENGYKFIPMDQNKRPLLKWGGRSLGIDELESYGLENISIRCGINKLVVFDIDSRNASDQKWMNEEFMARLREVDFDLAKVTIQKSLSNGVHIFCRTDKILKKQVLSKNLYGEVLVEVLSNGQLAKIYSPNIIEEINDIPELSDKDLQKLISISESFNEFNSKTEEKGDFQLYNGEHNCIDLLLHSGWSIVDEDINQIRVLRSGNPASSSSGVVNKNSNTAWIYSTSTPLPSGQLLRPTDITTYLEHDGNYKAFGKSLIGTLVPNDRNYTTTYTPIDQWEPISLKSLIEKGKELPPIKKLLGSLIFESEFTIFFGRTNVGKTTASVQIAMAIARGESLWGLINEAGPLSVLYMDCELSHRQLTKRYKNLSNIPDNLFYHVLPEFQDFASAEQWSSNIFDYVESIIQKSNVRVLFFDNLTALQDDSSKAEQAVELVKKIKYLKEKHNLTVIAIGHPTKHPAEVPIDINQLAGSSKLTALCDAVFAMNFSSLSTSERYIKCTKVRSDEMEFGWDNVIRLKLTADSGAPKFDFIGFAEEQELLGAHSSSGIDRTEVIRLLNEGHTYREIAKLTGIGKSTVGEIKKSLDESVRPANLADRTDKMDTNTKVGVYNPWEQQDNSTNGDWDDDSEPNDLPF